jgi:hypothetical protein
MRSITQGALRAPVAVAALAFLLPIASFAVIIKVHGPSGNADPEGMKTAAAALRENWNGPERGAASGTFNGFAYQIAPGPIVPRDFSPLPGTTTYLWSDETFRYESGFSFRGGPIAFGKPQAPRKALPSGGADAPAVVWTTQLRSARLKGSVLQVDYSLETAGPVSFEVFGIDGRTFGRWNWRDGAAGAYTKTVEAGRLPRNGALYLRWTNGKTRAIRNISITR